MSIVKCHKHMFNNQKGFTLLEALLALTIFSLLLFSAMNLELTVQASTKEDVVVQQFNDIQKGYARYIADNYNAIYAASAVPSVIPFSSLNSPYITMGIQANNAFGQTHCALIARSGTNLLALIVTEGGTNLPVSMLGSIVAKSKNMGMFNGATLEGVRGSWVLPNALTTFNNRNCSGTTVGAGNLTGLLFFNANDQNKEYMYRNATAGLPDRNMMHTILDMGTHDLNNLNTLTSQNITNAVNLNTVTTDVTGNVNNTNTTTTSTLNNANSVKVSGVLKTNNLTSLTNVVAGINTLVFGSDTGPDTTYLYLNDDAFLTTRAGGTVPLSQLLPSMSSRGAYAVTNGTTIVKPTECPNSSPTKPYAVLELTVASATMQTTLDSGVILDAMGDPYLWDGGSEYIKFNGYFTDTGASFQVFFTEYTSPNQTGPWTPRSNNGKGIAHVYCVM